MEVHMKEFLAKVWADLQQAHRSATIWFNGVMVAAMAGLPDLMQSFPQLHGLIPEAIYQHMWAFIVAGNIVLRFKTKSSLAEKKPVDGGA